MLELWSEKLLTTTSSGSSPGLWIATSNGTAGAYSTDGKTWKSMTLPASGNWQNAVYGNGTFVIADYTNALLAWSNNGINWTKVSISGLSGNRTAYLSFGNGVFVLVSSNFGYESYIYWSTNGKTWTKATYASGHWSGCAFGAGKFVTVHDYADSVKTLYSTDGKTWVAGGNMPSAQNWTQVSFMFNKFLATHTSVKGDFSAAATSTNGTSWTALTVDGISGVATTVVGPNIAIKETPIVSDGTVTGKYTTNVTNWTNYSFTGFPSNGVKVATDGKQFVRTAVDTNKVYVSNSVTSLGTAYTLPATASWVYCGYF